MNSFSEDAALSLILRYRGSNIEKLIPFIWQCKDDDRICSTELFIDAPQREMLLALKEVGKHMPVLPQTLKVSTPYWHSNLFVTNLRRSSSAGNPTPKDQPRLPVRALLRVIDFALDDLGPMKCKWDVEEYVDLCGKFRSLYSSKELKVCMQFAYGTALIVMLVRNIVHTKASKSFMPKICSCSILSRNMMLFGSEFWIFA